MIKVFTFLVLFVVACGPTRVHDATLANVDNMLAPKEIEEYKKNLPQVAYKELNDVLRSPETYWYDHKTVIPAYQDDEGSPLGARSNSSGKMFSLARHLFDGDHWVFPFAKTAGTDDSKNIVVANFISLPKVDGKRIPIGYRVITGNQKREYVWYFPHGTTMGEILYVRAPDGGLYVSEIRTRRRYKTDWATNVFRPFPTASHLISAIQRLRPNYRSQPQLVSMMQHLQRQDTLTQASVRGKLKNRPTEELGRNNDQVIQIIETRLAKIFSEEGALDILPNFNDAQLVKELLTKTTFVSSYEMKWKKNGAFETYAASTNESFSIVPDTYKAGLIKVNDVSCKRCHTFAGQDLRQLDNQLSGYGNLWGNDGIFSFQPFETERFHREQPNNLGSHVPNINIENRAIRKEYLDNNFVKLITQPEGFYNELPKGIARED